MKTALLIILVLLLTGLAVLALLINRWRNSPHGRLSLAAAIIGKLADWQAASGDKSPQAMRASRDKSIGFFIARPTGVHAVRDLDIPGPGAALPVRIYTPQASPVALPIIIYFHGGGWVLGNLHSHDNLCRTLAAKTSAIVVSVDYRLAPENPFPAALDDAVTALHWVVANAPTFNGDASRIALAGDSAGGNLAAALSLHAREQQGPAITAQALLYPAVDLSNLDRPSTLQFAQGLFLTRARMAWFIDQYVPDQAMRSNPLVSPLLAGNHQHLPPALIITAGLDPLRDEGEAYAAVLEQAGVATRLMRIEGVIHGFASMDRWFPESRQATDLVASFLREQFNTTASSSVNN